MLNVVVLPGQGVMDVVLGASGSLEGLMVFCADNGVGVTDVLTAGTTVVVSDVVLGLGNKGAREVLARRGLTLGTIGTDAVVAVTGRFLTTEGGDVLTTEGGDSIELE